MVDDSLSTDVRQLCLKLKPILDSKADQIYEAYLAEDESGRKQIEQYLQLLTAKYLPMKLSQTEVNLIPPSKENAAGEYQIGLVNYAGKELYPFGLREDEWIQHVAILGRSGAGKTNVGFVLLRELKRTGKIFCVLDWKRSYRQLISQPEFKNVEVYTIGRNVSPLSFNPLIPPENTHPKTWLKKLNEIIAHSYCLGNGVLFLLQQAVDAVYDEAGVYNGTVQRWPTFKDVLIKARSMDLRGRESGWLSSTLRALSSLCFGEMDTLLNTNSNQSLHHILDKSVILELDALTQSDKIFFAEALLLWIHHKRMAESIRENFSHVCVIEEAHHLLSDERRSLVGGQSVMEIIFREIREFGESIIILDQHPSKISLPALGNTYCTICMNLKHRSDINAMAQCLLLDKERDILGSLEVGQAVVKLQGRIPSPFKITIPEFMIEKNKVSDSFVKEHMKEIIQTELQEESLFPKKEDESDMANYKTHHAEKLILAFLQDVKQYPDSGIAARYKRLGLSVRQGQKLKAKALKENFIKESVKTTVSGRLKVIHLSKKGEAAIANTEKSD
jgi:hypothetical protein